MSRTIATISFVMFAWTQNRVKITQWSIAMGAILAVTTAVSGMTGLKKARKILKSMIKKILHGVALDVTLFTNRWNDR